MTLEIVFTASLFTVGMDEVLLCDNEKTLRTNESDMILEPCFSTNRYLDME